MMRKFYFLIWLGVAACTQQPADRFDPAGHCSGCDGQYESHVAAC